MIWSKDGDILTLGTTKINSDPRLNINHRYLNEWHLEIENVQNEDEGEYVCKTNSNFLKLLNLQVLGKEKKKKKKKKHQNKITFSININ